MKWSLVAVTCGALALCDLASAAPSASGPPQLDERILFELVRNPELLQIVNDYLDKKSGESPVSFQFRGSFGLPKVTLPASHVLRHARKRGRRRPRTATRRSAADPVRLPTVLNAG